MAKKNTVQAPKTIACKFAFPSVKGSFQEFPEEGTMAYVIVLPEKDLDENGQPTPHEVIEASVESHDDTIGEVSLMEGDVPVTCYLRDIFPHTASGKKACNAEVAHRLKLYNAFIAEEKYRKGQQALLILDQKQCTAENIAAQKASVLTYLVSLMGHNPFEFFQGIKGEERVKKVLKAAKAFHKNVGMVRKLKKEHSANVAAFVAAYGENPPTENDLLYALWSHEPIKRDESRAKWMHPHDVWVPSKKASKVKEETEESDEDAPVNSKTGKPRKKINMRRSRKSVTKGLEPEGEDSEGHNPDEEEDDEEIAEKPEKGPSKAQLAEIERLVETQKSGKMPKKPKAKKVEEELEEPAATVVGDYVRIGEKKYKISGITGKWATIVKDGKVTKIDRARASFDSRTKEQTPVWVLTG